MDRPDASPPPHPPPRSRHAAPRRARSHDQPAMVPSAHPAHNPGSLVLQAKAPRRTLRFRLQVDATGLYVEREEISCRGLHCVQSMHFSSPQAFARWCDSDPARFEQPLLHQRLQREAQALWPWRGPDDA